MQSQPARELTPEEGGNMTDEQLGHLALDLSVNSYTLIANEATRRKALERRPPARRVPGGSLRYHAVPEVGAPVHG